MKHRNACAIRMLSPLILTAGQYPLATRYYILHVSHPMDWTLRLFLHAKASRRLVMDHLRTSAPAVSGFAQLLSNHYFAASTASAGLTWLELFILSVAASHNPAGIYMSQTAAPAKKLSYLLREFVTQAKRYLEFAYVRETVELFHTAHHPPNRLVRYGYINKLTHTAAHIQQHADATDALNTAMLDLQHQVTKTQGEQLRNCCLSVQAKRFAGYTTLRLHSQITHLTKVLHERHGQRIVDFLMTAHLLFPTVVRLATASLATFSHL